MAALVHGLDLEHNRITLALSNWAEDEEGNDDAQTRAATLARPAASLCYVMPVPVSGPSAVFLASGPRPRKATAARRRSRHTVRQHCGMSASVC